MINRIKIIKKKHIEHTFLWISMGIMTFGAFLISYWCWFPRTVITFTAPVIVNKTEYNKGEQIIYSLSYCKNNNQIGTIYRTLVNGTVTSFTPVSSNLPSGCKTIKKNDLVIPENIDNGLYHLENTIEYKVNPIRTVVAHWKSNEFIIK